MTEVLHDDLLDGIYKIAVEPERFRELTQIWGQYLSKIEVKEHPERVSDYAQLEKHLNQARSILDMVESSGNTKAISLTQRLEKESQPMFAVNQNGVVEVVNNAARTHLGIQPDTALSDISLTTDALEVIDQELTARLSRDNPQNLGLMQIRFTHSDTPLTVSLTDWQTATGRNFVLFKTTNIVWPDYLTPVITQAFGLSSAEADILRLLVEGASIEDAAIKRGRRVSTVRSQIRSLYKKTETKNQAELIRMAIGLTTLQNLRPNPLLDFKSNQRGKAPIAYPHLEHMRQLSLPDGRQIEYAIFGATDGQPVLYFHNELLGNIWPRKLAEYAAIRGLKIIVPSRPYYGQSAPYPKGCFHPTQTADDFAKVLDYLDIPKAVLMGQTLGGMFAMAFAHLYPERSLGMLGLCPMLPHTHKNTEAQLPALHKFITSILLRKPILLEFLGRAGNAYYKRVGPVRFLHYAFGDLACNLPYLEDEEALEGLMRGLALGEPNDHKGYVAGFKHIIYEAEDMLRDIEVPVYLMIGDCDGNTRLARAEALKEKGIDLNIIMAEGGGELLKYSHPELIVDSLCQIFKAD